MATNSNNPTWTEADQKEYDKYKKFETDDGLLGRYWWGKNKRKKTKV